LRRIKILSVLILSLVLQVEGHAQNFSSHAEISLITCSPGSELYSIFGHSAIRVKDSTTNTDLIFNYGVFDFNTPNFYWKFIRGKMQYKLAIQRMDDFVFAYAAEGRSIKEEKLRLNQREKARIIDFLRINHLPENRYYLYDFFYNNCSTKIWDVADDQIDDSLRFDTSVYSAHSFRDLLYIYLEEVPWSKLGIDLLLGMPADKIASFEQQMYLPDFLSRNMSHTYRLDPSGGKEPLMGPEEVILEKNENISGVESSFFTPALVFSLLGVVLVVLTFSGGRGIKRWLDATLMLCMGLLGVLLLFMWFATNHQQMDWNLNLLWANPLGLVFFYYALRNKMDRAGIVFGVMFVFLAVNLVGWMWLPQQFNLSLIPLVIALVIRALDNVLPICCPFVRFRKNPGTLPLRD